MQGFVLPDPPTGDALITATQASLHLLSLARDSLALPLLASIFRAAVTMADQSVFLVGPSGAGKTELAALAQQHYGAAMDARHLPGSWTSTENALEALAFILKDALMVVDDFAPRGKQSEIQDLHAKADRLLRGQGNNAGRGRMNSDTTLKGAKPPRGLIVATGEDLPAGTSLKSRMLILEVAPGDINMKCLTPCQHDARAGLYTQCLAGFVHWLSADYPNILRRMQADFEQWRIDASFPGQHHRTPGIVAHLAVGLDLFLRFALDAGAIDQACNDELWQRGWAAFVEAASHQSQHVNDSDPTQLWLELLIAAISGGQAHLANPGGNEPLSPATWGWREFTIGTGDNERQEWRPQGERIGWVAGEDVYLVSAVAYRVAKRMGSESGDTIAITPKTLNKRLHERGYLVSTEKSGRNTLTVRKTFEGRRQDVLHLRASTFCGKEDTDHEATDPKWQMDADLSPDADGEQ